MAPGRAVLALALLGALLVRCGHAKEQAPAFDPLDYVDPLIGTGADGHVFPGATLPYGLAKPGADTDSSDNQGGFASSPPANITGFSILHDSGTGGAPSLGNFALFPHASCAGGVLERCVFSKKARKTGYVNGSVVSRPGYFGVKLATGVGVEMSATRRAGLFRFSFEGEGERKGGPVLVMDLTDLSDSRQDNATITVDSRGRMTGGGVFKPSFGSGSYAAFFCADFQGPVGESGVWINDRASRAVRNVTVSRSINNYPLPAGGWVGFKEGTREVVVRVGVSMVSSARACESAEGEIPGWDFEGIRAAGEAAWREKIRPIRVSEEGVERDMLVNFYSGIYRTMVNPQDWTGENPLWSSTEPYFDSFYCLWDSFRSQIPFLVLLDPKQTARMIRALIDIYRHDGWLPDCRMSLSRGYTQGGSNADIVLADAHAKGLTSGIDWEAGYAAVVKDAEIEPFDWCCHGRGGLDSWHELGYIPVGDFDWKGFGTMTRSVSRTLEYAYNDFVIAGMAARLGGREGDVEKYTRRSGGWLNLFNPSMRSAINGTSTNFTGFFQPRYANRTWGYQDPLKCSNIDPNPNSVCSLQNTGAETFESSVWEYGFFVPHDQATLIGTLGGPETFVRRLDFLHDSNITYIGNEPAFLTVFQYHYAGRPGLSAKRAHAYIPSSFSPTPAGLPGNDDSGAMGSFLAFAMMGAFPNPGQDVYLLTPPFFASVSITSPLTGKTATIRNANFDSTYKAIYIQSATLDGAPYTKNWIRHDFFLRGGTLVFVLGRNESTWGTREEDLPPSAGRYGYEVRNLTARVRAGTVRYKYSEGLEAGQQYWGAGR
ncbi:glycoside hydrolase family 92 protein [Trichodelitschia bisporula]|uniref:Glycoside hydrolase family 92 protein n=1 Tax=Trichodelitschia bisporula TaxID=703511 RepID=A0A6G1HKH7_9PEZI|nr:glycoside hydrolase family 92 protein [Trichodelitschia bisporula]